jgi:Glycosyltransferase family 87
VGALLSNRLVRVISVCLWGISVVALALGVLHKAHRVHGNDFTMYLDAAKALIAGQSPYAMAGTFHYMYPLFLAAVLGPLVAVPRDVATIVWFLASVVSLLGAARVTVGLARVAGVIRTDVPLTVPLIALWFLLFDPIQSDLLNGQVNFQVLLLCVLSLRACLTRRTFGSAWPLAAAIAVKLNPALLLGFLGARRRWVAIALCLALTAVFVFTPLVALGRTGWSAYGTYLSTFLLPRLSAEIPSHRDVRFSVNGVLGALVPAWGQALWRRAVGASLPLLGLVVVENLSRRWRPAGQELWIFCLYLMALPMMTPFSEVHHLAYAFPGAALLALRSLPEVSASRSRPSALGVAAAFLLLAGGRLDRSGPYFFLALCLIGVLLAVEALRSSAPRAAEGRGPLSARS